MKDDVRNKLRMADYLYNDLEPDDSLEFERMISENPELAESYHFNVKVRDYLKAKIQLEEMRSDPLLGEAERQAELAFESDSVTNVSGNLRSGSNTGFRKKLRYIPAVAAVIVILLVIRLFVPVTNPDTLFKAYYEPLSATDYNQRGEINGVYPNLSEGIDLYNQGAYEQSIQILDKVETVQDELSEVELFQGLNYIGLEQYGTAKGILANYIENNTRFLPEALWYLSLCYLKTGEYAKSSALLTRLEAYDGMYMEDAQSLERKLRRIK
jgi:hypothetical protein